MKKMILLMLVGFHWILAAAQNVGIGTTTPVAKLHIKGSQDSSQLVIDANATQSNTHPLLLFRKADGSELSQIHADDTSNIFIGFHTGATNQVTLSTFDAKANTAVGGSALAANTRGFMNTALGYQTLENNTTGGLNTAVGAFALQGNTTGGYNAAFGHEALVRNGTGSYNTALGILALFSNNGDLGSYNTAVGYQALQNTANSEYNTAIGYNAGKQYDNGYNNVFVGANTDVSGPGFYNVIAIGQATICTGSSQVTMGNGATGEYRAYANWSNISDGRFKKNVRENVPGLDFITRLRPVTYNLSATELNIFLHRRKGSGATAVAAADAAKESKATEVFNKALKEKETEVVSGFVAQDVEAAAKAAGYSFSGVEAPKNDNDVYALRYAEFVVPLVKAVQEQQQMIAALQKKVDRLEKQLQTTQK